METTKPATNTREEFRKNIVKSTGKAKLRMFCNALILKPTKIARTIHCCDLCACPIEIGSQYKGGSGRHVHLDCLMIVQEEVWK